MKRILALAILATMFVGCEEEKTPVDKNFIPTGIYFNYGIEETRTSATVDNGTTYFLWTKGDKIGVSCEQSNVTNKEIALPEQFDNQNRASFATGIEFNDAQTNHTFNIYYPYKASSAAFPVNPTSVSHTLSANQNGNIGANDFMWDQVVTTKEKPSAWSNMKHPFAYVRFYVVNIDDANTSINDKEISSITISADGILAGNFTADFNNFAKNEVTFGGATSNSITLTAPLKVLSKSAYTEAKKNIPNDYPVMIINPAGVGESFDASVQVVGMAPQNTTFNMGNRKFEANNFYNIGLGGSFKDGKLTFSVIAWEQVTADVTFN